MLELGSHLDLAMKFLEEVQTIFFFRKYYSNAIFPGFISWWWD